MQTKYFRTHLTSLTDDELSLLDVMFDCSVTPPMLRQCNFIPQFNVAPHSLDDSSVKSVLRRFVREKVIKPLEFTRHGHRYITMTEYGASLWTKERCPIWERYCMDREGSTIRGKIFTSVRAVSPAIRDDWLRIAVRDSIRVRRATIRDNGLIPWRSFGSLHVGLVASLSSDEIHATELERWIQDFTEHSSLVERERTWWRSVKELQKFMNN